MVLTQERWGGGMAGHLYAEERGLGRSQPALQTSAPLWSTDLCCLTTSSTWLATVVLRGPRLTGDNCPVPCSSVGYSWTAWPGSPGIGSHPPRWVQVPGGVPSTPEATVLSPGPERAACVCVCTLRVRVCAHSCALGVLAVPVSTHTYVVSRLRQGRLTSLHELTPDVIKMCWGGCSAIMQPLRWMRRSGAH